MIGAHLLHLSRCLAIYRVSVIGESHLTHLLYAPLIGLRHMALYKFVLID